MRIRPMGFVVAVVMATVIGFLCSHFDVPTPELSSGTP